MELLYHAVFELVKANLPNRGVFPDFFAVSVLAPQKFKKGWRKREGYAIIGTNVPQAVEKVLPAKGFGRRDSLKGDHQGPLFLKSTTF